MVTPISQMYIDMIKAFRADCDMLIGKFKNEENNDMKTFVMLWDSSNFNLLYDRKYSKHGMEHDFMKDTLQIAKLIMVNDNFTAGLFLMYGLYCLQDYPTGCIRLQLDEFCYILKMLRLKEEENKARNQQATWLFSMLLKRNAFEFVVFGREYDMEGQHRAEMIYNNQYEFSDDESPTFTKPKDWVRNLSKDFPKEMTDLESDYLKMKNKIKAVFPFLNLSLDMVQEDIATTLLRSLTQADSMAEPGNADTSIGAKRRKLKNRKMRIKHRYQHDDTDEESAPQVPPSKMKKRRGCPRGERKLFFNKAINDPDLETSSDSGDSLVLDARSLESQLCLPNL